MYNKFIYDISISEDPENFARTPYVQTSYQSFCIFLTGRKTTTSQKTQNNMLV